MDRLTQHTQDNFGYCEYELKANVDELDVVVKLGEYEDIGLTPKEIEEMKRYIERLEASIETYQFNYE